MNVLREFPRDHVSPSTHRRGGAQLLLVAVAVLVSACGSGNESTGASDAVATTAVVVAGAQENSIIVPKGDAFELFSGDISGLKGPVASGAVCYGWPNGTKDAQPCAVGLKGPGGGRVFYDAGSVQPWGRFLEVAPQSWNGTLYDCPGLFSRSCGAENKRIPRKSSDKGAHDGYKNCFGYLEKIVGMSRAIGAGRANTVRMLDSVCGGGSVPAGAFDTVFQWTQPVIAGLYRGGGLADWYLPSLEELRALCFYGGRNAIGGFSDSDSFRYATSTTRANPNFNRLPGEKEFFYVAVQMDSDCSSHETEIGASLITEFAVRPIRAFS